MIIERPRPSLYHHDPERPHPTAHNGHIATLPEPCPRTRVRYSVRKARTATAVMRKPKERQGEGRQVHAAGVPPPAIALSAAIPSRSVATSARVSPGTGLRSASAQLPAGTRNYVAPAARAPPSFCGIPPIGPTAPASSMVPVPAMMRSPVRSAGHSTESNETATEIVIPLAVGPPSTRARCRRPGRYRAIWPHAANKCGSARTGSVQPLGPRWMQARAGNHVAVNA